MSAERRGMKAREARDTTGQLVTISPHHLHLWTRKRISKRLGPPQALDDARNNVVGADGEEDSAGSRDHEPEYALRAKR